MCRIVTLLTTALVMLVLPLTGCLQQTVENIRLQDAAMTIQKILQDELNSLDKDLSTAASQLGATGLTGADAEKVLLGICDKRAWVVDCSTVDANGKMITVMPQVYGIYEGSDISGQEQVITLMQTKKPVFSHSFKAVEGFYAVDMEYPIFSQDGSFMGSVSALISPKVLFDEMARPVLTKTNFEKVWSMQKDGLIIFDYDESEIGTNLFTDPLYQPYPELLSLGNQIVDRLTGCGNYRFLNLGMEKPVAKQVCWSTVIIHGTQWRIIVAQVIEK